MELNRPENRNVHKTRFTFPEININPEGAILAFDKPYRCTSFDIVAKLKNYIKKEMKIKMKVGHAGTLDPLATGLMIVCVGSYTKKIDSLMGLEKEYTGTIQLGATTSSFDLEKEINETFPYDHITEEMIYKTAETFLGDIEQIPPHFSAVKINGKRAYELAREGQEAEIKPKQINISEFEITRIELPDVDFRIVCSKGTYIRSIARDFGESLSSGAHLTALRRTRIGNLKVEDAIQVILTVENES
jgi:tRNA pseudouridine55 synthase